MAAIPANLSLHCYPTESDCKSKCFDYLGQCTFINGTQGDPCFTCLCNDGFDGPNCRQNSESSVWIVVHSCFLPIVSITLFLLVKLFHLANSKTGDMKGQLFVAKRRALLLASVSCFCAWMYHVVSLISDGGDGQFLSPIWIVACVFQQMEDWLNYAVYMHIFWYWASVSAGGNMAVFQAIESWKPYLVFFLGLSFLSKVVVHVGYYVLLAYGVVLMSFDTRTIMKGCLNSLFAVVMIGLCVVYGQRMIKSMKWTNTDSFLTFDSSNAFNARIRFFTRFLLIYTLLESLQLVVTWAELATNLTADVEALHITTTSFYSLVITLERIGVVVMFRSSESKVYNFYSDYQEPTKPNPDVLPAQSVDGQMSIDASWEHVAGASGYQNLYESMNQTRSVAEENRDAICLDNQ